MSFAAKIKRYTPKTPKQWMLLVVGGGGAALLANYVYAKDRSVLSKFWRGVQGKPSPVPPPGSVRAPTHAHASGMNGLPSFAVYVEPTQQGNPPIPPEVYAPMYGGVPYFARYFPAPNTESNHQTGAMPKAWDGIRSKVPPPGAYGVASVTPPAPTDPGAPQPAPCGPGLTFDPATGSCMPYPMTPPYGGM